MTWTYNPAAIKTSIKDQVRLVIGDTVFEAQQLQDEEIAYLLTIRSSVYGVAAECCRALATQYSRSVDRASGSNKAQFSQLAKAYGMRATAFEQRAALGGSGVPFAGGLSISEKVLGQSDNDRVQPQFTIGMEDNFLPVSPVDAEDSLAGTGSVP